MPSPFVGMNPFLEAPELWAGVHHLLIGAIAQTLNPILRPHYFVAVEERVYDQDSIGYLEGREVNSGVVVTAIEILSPINKRSGLGRRQYEAKRQKLLTTPAHLVEIDLLRQSSPMPVSGGVEAHYRILVSRSEQRPKADLFAFNLPDAIPTFALPLLPGDAEPIVDLKALIESIYDQGSYDLRLNYGEIPAPMLSQGDRVWVAGVLGDRSD
jgi:Protein of unknown function (DUF4058)